MGAQGSGPPDKIIVLNASKFTREDDFSSAVSTLYDQGFRYEFTVDNWIGFRLGYDKSK